MARSRKDRPTVIHAKHLRCFAAMATVHRVVPFHLYRRVEATNGRQAHEAGANLFPSQGWDSGSRYYFPQ